MDKKNLIIKLFKSLRGEKEINVIFLNFRRTNKNAKTLLLFYRILNGAPRPFEFTASNVVSKSA
jgi:hypothetical protein